MAISALNTYSTNINDWYNQSSQNTSTESSSQNKDSITSATTGASTTLTSQISGMIELTKYAMDAMGLSSDSRITFSKITQYREQLQNEFDTAVKEGLTSLGISENVKFTLKANEDGTISVSSSNSTEKDKIQNFFDNNPELIKKYKQIEALKGVDDARNAMQISPIEMRKRIEIESMVTWWNTSGNSNSYFGNYSSNGLSMMNGLNINI